MGEGQSKPPQIVTKKYQDKMKTIFRIIIILLAAVLVSGAFYLGNGSANTAQTAGTSVCSSFKPGGRPGVPPNGSDDNFSGGDREGEGGASIGGGILGMLGSLLKISVITALFLLIQKGIRGLKPSKKLDTATG